MSIGFDKHLNQQINDYCSECEPKSDKEGNVINCCECDQEHCEFYSEYNEPEQDYRPDNEEEMTSLARHGDYLSA